MNERLELIIKKFKKTLEKYPTCDECDIRHTCAKIGNKEGSYICDILDMMEDEMLEPVNEGALLEYALEKLGMSKEELESEMNEDKEDIKKAKEIVRIDKEADAYCDSFKWECQGCKVKEFKDKYRRLGRMICNDVYKYLKEKGEI